MSMKSVAAGRFLAEVTGTEGRAATVSDTTGFDRFWVVELS